MRFLPALAALGLAAASFVAPASAQQQVRVGIIPVLGTAPVLVLDKEGWAKQAGLDLKFTTFESGPLMIQALASGTLDVYVAGVAPLGVARSRALM
jgi:NitT/TauT family transport system substrate-binding protein